MTDLRLEYVPLDEVEPNPSNPKSHDAGAIHVSVDTLGYIDPVIVDERTGMLVAGHGRRDVLNQKRQSGDDPPDGIRVDADGRWLVPVVRGWASRDDDEASRAGIALNRTGELGGWHDDLLAARLAELAASEAGLVGTGFDADDLQGLVERLGDTFPYNDDESGATTFQCRTAQCASDGPTTVAIVTAPSLTVTCGGCGQAMAEVEG